MSVQPFESRPMPAFTGGLALLALWSAFLLLPCVAHAEEAFVPTHRTSTTVRCPEVLPRVPGTKPAFNCRAVASGLGLPLPDHPLLNFDHSGPGTFDADTCVPTPVPEHLDQVACEVVYRGAAFGAQTITAEYPGAEMTTIVFEPSTGSTGITVGNVDAIRFAAPRGTGSEPCAIASAPCSLFTAMSPSAPGTTAVPGEEVVLAPGTYSRGQLDFGPSDTLTALDGLTIRGQAGQPRPKLEFTGTGHLELGDDELIYAEVTSEGPRAIVSRDGLIEGVIARDTGAHAISCFVEKTRLLDTVCMSSGTGSAAAGLEKTLSGEMLFANLHNVTAVSSGAESVGLLYAVTGSGAPPALAVQVLNTIAHGTKADVVAESRGPTGSAGQVHLNFETSDYATTEDRADGTGVATVTPAGSNGNINSPPLLAADGFHETGTSPTIDHGGARLSAGNADIDGEPRFQGSSIDIGADENLRGTATSISCASPVLRAGTTVTCTVHVEDLFDPPSPLGGKLEIIVPQGSGEIVGRSLCLLGVTLTQVSCDFTYKAGQVAGTARLTGSFGHVFADHDGVHSRSSDTTELEVVAEAETNTTLHCAAAVSLGRGAPCTVEVSSKASPGDVATGEVAFSSSNAGSGFQPRSCQLDSVGRCQLTYVPTGPRARPDTLTAAYQGATGAFKPSNGTTAIDVGAEETTTELLCAASASASVGAPCTVEVHSKENPAHLPAGRVSLSSTNGGSGFQPKSCDLDNAGKCHLVYLPKGAAPRTDALTASYQDATGAFKASTDAATIDIKTAGPPDTTIKKKPRKKTTGRKAKFIFVADQPGATFQCKLDKGPFKSCRSPFKRKVKPGRHSFQVRASNAAGTDPTPAKFSWRVS